MKYYIFNTNERNAPGQYTVWLERDLAFEHAYPNEPKGVDALEPGDLVFMYINKLGVKAIGKVLARRDTIAYRYPDHMIARLQRTDRNEYRIPINWYLVLEEPISHAELKDKHRIIYQMRAVFPIQTSAYKAEELVCHLEEVHTRASGEIDPHQLPEPLREGNLRQVMVNRHERNAQARAECVDHYGCKCKVCGFSFEETYGELGQGVIEVHHVKPLSECDSAYEVDPLEDLIPVCSNCHSIIHRRCRALSIKEIKEMLNAQQRSLPKLD